MCTNVSEGCISTVLLCELRRRQNEKESDIDGKDFAGIGVTIAWISALIFISRMLLVSQRYLVAQALETGLPPLSLTEA